MSESKQYAVLTGDIIKSTSLSIEHLEAVRSQLSQAVQHVKLWKRGLVRGGAEFFRGDSWQMLLTDPAMGLRVAVYVRASLLAHAQADTRVSIGLGSVENISTKRISLSTGAAFLMSGRGLDRMTGYEQMTIEISASAQPLSGWLPVVGHLCDALIGQWTARQAEIVTHALGPTERTHEDISLNLDPQVSKQAVTKALHGANWHALRECILQFEKSNWASILSHAGMS